MPASVLKFNEALANLSVRASSMCAAELASVITAATILESRTSYSVTNLDSLPPAVENEGRFIFVESISAFRYSDGAQWINNFVTTVTSTDPNLWTWGYNNCGQLGTNDITNRSSPGTVSGGGTNWVQVNNAGQRVQAIKKDGTLWTWGRNSLGQLGTNNTTDRSSPGTVAGGGTNWLMIAGSAHHTVAIKNDGTLWSWGSNDSGQLGTNNTTDRSSPGTTAGCGDNWSFISAGFCIKSSLGIKSDGTLWTWGTNSLGQLGTNNTTDRSSPGTVAGGGTNWLRGTIAQFAAGVKSDGTLWTWGNNNCGQLGDNSIIDRCSPGTVAGGGTNWSCVAIGVTTSAGIKCDGTLWTWGVNASGVLGNGSTTNRSSPGTVAGAGTNWCLVSIGRPAMGAIKTNGTLWTWGYGGCGQLGSNATTDRCSPVTVAGGGTRWYSISMNTDVNSLHTTGIQIPPAGFTAL